MRIGSTLATVCIWGVACGFPQPGAVPIDAAPSPDAAVAPPNTVLGHASTRCAQTSGEIVTNADLSAATIRALVPDGSLEGYTAISGVGAANGTFEIDHVPDGMTYLLQINTVYYETASHVIDLEGDVAMRCSPAPTPVTLSTKIHLDGSQLTAFAPQDTITVDSLAVAMEAGPLISTPWAKSLSLDLDWNTEAFGLGPQRSLVDQTLGDDLIIRHDRASRLLGTGDGRFVQMQSIAEIFQASNVKMADGVSATVSGTFTSAGTPKQVTLIAQRAAYDAGFDNASTFLEMTVQLVAHPIANDSGNGELLAELDFTDWSGTGLLQHGVTAAPYLDPFPTTWHRYVSLAYARGRSVVVPGATSAVVVRSTSSLLANLGTTLPANPLQPPGSVKVGGHAFSAGGTILLSGAPVPLTWTKIQTAKLYIVTIRRAVRSNTKTKLVQVATMLTTNASLAIPADVFTDGAFFVFTVASITDPADYANGHLVQNGTPATRAETPSGLFRVSSLCGNGHTDGDEECDTSGETATCDADCTLPKCGDGLRNVAAGEACDTIVDTAGCDAATCKVPVCGDGHVNLALEDCDPGTGTEPGCGASCRFTNICGNGTTEPREQCDSTGMDTVACNSDCTTPSCGDGHVNAATGEQCDDGPDNGTDGHCSATCTLVSTFHAIKTQRR